MRIDYHRDFKKEFRKLNPKQQLKFSERLDLFLNHQTHPLLRLHELSGEFTGNFSISIAGDLRAHFKYASQEHIILTRIGTHAQLHK